MCKEGVIYKWTFEENPWELEETLSWFLARTREACLQTYLQTTVTAWTLGDLFHVNAPFPFSLLQDGVLGTKTAKAA